MLQVKRILSLLTKCKCAKTLRKQSMDFMPARSMIFISPAQMLFCSARTWQPCLPEGPLKSKCTHSLLQSMFNTSVCPTNIQLSIDICLKAACPALICIKNRKTNLIISKMFLIP